MAVYISVVSLLKFTRDVVKFASEFPLVTRISRMYVKIVAGKLLLFPPSKVASLSS